MEHKKNYGWKGFFPLFTFLAIYLGGGLIFTALGYGDTSFKQIPRLVALIGALLVCMCMGGKERSLEFRMDTFCKGMSDQGTMIMIIVYLLAGAFSGVAKAMGGVQASANLGLSLIPAKFLFSGMFLISAFMATAMGTSMGTISAVGPVAAAVAQSANLNPALAIGTVLGGAMFGDNLSMISDTTIAATRGCGCEMRDKFKMNGAIAAVAAAITMILYALVGSSAELSGDFSYDFVKVIPYLFILLFALTGCNVFILLLAGIGVAAVIGFATGSFDLPGFAQAMGDGMSGMYEICLLALLLRGVGSIAEELGAIDWLVSKMHAKVKSRRGAEFMTAGMVSVFDAAIANNTLAIMMTAPLVRSTVAQHNIAPKRVASILDIFSCVVQGMVPHGGQILLCVSLTGMSPFNVIASNYYCFLLALVALATIRFGLGRTREEKAGIRMYDENDEVIACHKVDPMA